MAIETAFRFLCLCGAVCATCWAWTFIGTMSDARIVGRFADKYTAVDSFTKANLRTLALLEIETAPFCSPTALRGMVTIRLHASDLALQVGERRAIDEAFVKAKGAATRALTCAPTDAFPWLALYWIALMQEGSTPHALSLLEQSYAFGRNEAWIELRRCKLAFNVLHLLPPALRTVVIDEFVDLVRLNFFEEAGDILVGSGWSHRAAISERLAILPQRTRYLFGIMLYHAGVSFSVPGVDVPDPRPWH